jgi:hypothetical protein
MARFRKLIGPLVDFELKARQLDAWIEERADSLEAASVKQGQSSATFTKSSRC